MKVQKTRNPSVLVLLATFNGARFLSNQIATITQQDDVDVNVVARDDGSDDGTPALLSCQDRVKVFDGVGTPTGSAARNFLEMLKTVDFGDAQYIALSDQDDLWLSSKLQRAIICLNNSGSSGYSCNLSAFDNVGRRPPWLLLKHGPQKRFDHLFQGASAGCTYVLTRACADAIKEWLGTVRFPIDMGISHDWLIYAFVRNSNLTWYCDDRALILYRQHDMNVYGSKRGLADMVGRVQLLRENWYRRHIIWISEQLILSSHESDLIRRIKRLSIIDRVWLFIHANKLRRRSRDVMMLRIALLTFVF